MTNDEYEIITPSSSTSQEYKVWVPKCLETSNVCPKWYETEMNMNEDNKKNNYVIMRIILIGKEGGGKRAIRERYLENRFDEYVPCADEYEKKWDIKNKKGDIIRSYLFQCWNSRPEDQHILRGVILPSVQTFLLVYSMNSIESFDALECKYIEMIDQKNGVNQTLNKDYHCILVCTKCDLDEKERQVTFEQGVEFAKAKNIPFVQCSAKNATNIDFLFEQVIVKHRWLMLGRHETK